jgi:hypothetical protein
VSDVMAFCTLCSWCGEIGAEAHATVIHGEDAAVVQQMGRAFIVQRRSGLSEGEGERPALDAAWHEAEAALPEGWHLCLLTHEAQGWVATAYRSRHDGNGFDAAGPTPAAALQALRRRAPEVER